jgi:protein tyrosine phosphatase (PTP) superfamily phosphohydrolase (DUF442 family)/cytochrome c556
MSSRFCASAQILAIAVVLCAGASLISCTAQNDKVPDSRKRGSHFPQVANPEALHNGHIVTARVISGAQPEGDESFNALREMGVKTIISVDGAQPDVEGARKYGLRYVHLPITYATVTEQQGKEIAKAIDELPGPIYVHCHHGKHRSAAAVAVACVYNGQIKPEQAEDVLKTFGTGENYKGLWKAARDARPLKPEEYRLLDVKFVEKASIPPIAQAMVQVDFHNENLKASQKAGWGVPPEHPGIDPAHEALQLQEHFRELGRTQEFQARPADFRKWMLEGEEASKALREALSANPVNAGVADAAFKRVGRSCVDCHASYRN